MQLVQEIIYFAENPFVREKDFVEIRVRSGDSPEVRSYSSSTTCRSGSESSQSASLPHPLAVSVGLSRVRNEHLDAIAVVGVGGHRVAG